MKNIKKILSVLLLVCIIGLLSGAEQMIEFKLDQQLSRMGGGKC